MLSKMGSMRSFRIVVASWAALACSLALLGQAEYRVYAERPRLFLESQRLERLRKEVERGSLRWEALQGLVKAGTVFPEQPLVDGLLFQLEGSEASGRRAVEWAERLARKGVRTAGDLRHAALVYDWCYELFPDTSRRTVRDALSAGVDALLPQANLGPGLLRAGVLAAISLAGDWPGAEPALAALIGAHWRDEISPVLESGGLSDDGSALIAVLETSLAVRHNLETDLLAPATDALAALVRTRLLSYYPLDIETAHGLVPRPSRFGDDEEAAGLQAPLYRIADMLLVAYEANLQEFQFLQGWIRDDKYRLPSPLGAPYDLLWVNPYLPGLTPQSAPLLAHDPVRGRLYGRFGWEDSAGWIGYVDGRLWMLADSELSVTDAVGGLDPLFFPEAVVVPVAPPARLALTWQPDPRAAPEAVPIYLIGLRPGEQYALKVGGRHARLFEAGNGGIHVLRADRSSTRRDRIDLRKKVRIEVQPTLKPTDPRRPRPSLAP